ncbi:hypothetical protein C0995_002664 [Termitomyces sp. Mi166|nr:hypothetical protein C0995_002664 [Termitomyces sp. Mi166\
MATQTTAVLKPDPLRHRTHVFDGKTHTTHSITFPPGSVTSSDSAKDFSFTSDLEEKEPEKERRRRPALVEDEDDSDSEDSENAEDNTSARKEERGVSESTNSISWTQGDLNSLKTHNSRAWYEFDLAVLVALVSPIGNWLTGGDYIKNVCLIMLLIFYLHQIIEVPWQLYHNARPRRRAPAIPPSNAEDHYRHIATSELRALEFFFLVLTALSPLFGAVFLRYATAAVIGEEAVSWFNTALFVMATGMRPWSHIIERLKKRTTDLHDVIHYPSPELSANDMHIQVTDLMKRVEHLERALSKAKAKIIDTTEEVYDYVDEAVTVVDRSVKRHQKKYEKQEQKVREMEQTLEGLQGKGKQRAGVSGLTIRTSPSSPSFLTKMLPAWMSLDQPFKQGAHSPSSYSPTKHPLRSFPSSSSTQLHPIPEEESARYPILARPAAIMSLVLSKVGYVATLPLRTVFRMIFERY